MAYNNNIPQPTDTIASSQSPILQNFQAIKQLIDVNHGTFGGTGVNQEGKHKFVEMPDQTADPAGATGEMTLYAKTYTKTSQSEAFVLRNDLAGPNTPIPFTACLANQNGWAWLPCGLLMKWGNFALSSGTNAGTPFSYPSGVAIPAFTAQPFMLQTSLISGSAPSGNSTQYHAIVYTPLATGFTVAWNVASALNLSYLAIGPATP